MCCLFPGFHENGEFLDSVLDLPHYFCHTTVLSYSAMFPSISHSSIVPLIRHGFEVAKPSIATTRVMSSFQAWRVQQLQDGNFQGSEHCLSTDRDIPEAEGTVLVKVSHSALNYKDALSAAGNKGVTKAYPHTPGIDAAGKIVGSGRDVIVTGYDLGMNTDGGFGEFIRVPEKWCVSLPKSWDSRTAMVYGTAGLTAGLCIQKILRMGAAPDDGKVVVTGGSGSVGSVAVEILSRLGFHVVAISGKRDKYDFLKQLGAAEVVGRDALGSTKKPLVKPVFANAIDTVGGGPLSELLKQIQPGGSIACCGMVAGSQLEMSVFPFILRGVNLLGVDSVEIPIRQKEEVWKKLAGEWACPKTVESARDIGRHELDGCLKAFLSGESSGKIVLDHSLTKYKL